MLVDTAVSVRLEKLAMIVTKVSESVADQEFPRRVREGKGAVL